MKTKKDYLSDYYVPGTVITLHAFVLLPCYKADETLSLQLNPFFSCQPWLIFLNTHYSLPRYLFCSLCLTSQLSTRKHVVFQLHVVSGISHFLSQTCSWVLTSLLASQLPSSCPTQKSVTCPAASALTQNSSQYPSVSTYFLLGNSVCCSYRLASLWFRTLSYTICSMVTSS